jgi:hypothetical protein
MLFHVIAHVQTNERFFIVKHESGKRFCELGFPTPVGPRKMNDPIGRFSSDIPARDRRSAFETAVIVCLAQRRVS